MDAKTRTQAEAEGLQMRKIVWVTRPGRQEAECGHKEGIGFRQRYHRTPVNETLGVFWSRLLYAS